MSWRNRLEASGGKAKFGDVEFYWHSIADTSGQRITVDAPLNAKPTARALGQTINRVTVNGYFIGDDPHIAHEKMRAAAISRKSQTFAHPYLGDAKAWLQSYSATDSKNIGGVINFKAEFILAEETQGLAFNNAPDSPQVARSNTRREADKNAAALEVVAKVINPLVNREPAVSAASGDVRTSVLGGITKELQDIMSSAEDAIAARATIADVQNQFGEVSEVVDDATVLRGFVTELTPENILGRLARRTLGRGNISKALSFINRHNNSSNTIAGYTARIANAAVLNSAANQIADAGLESEFPSRETAEQARTQLAEAFSNAADNAPNDETAIGLNNINAALKSQFDTELPNLARLVRVTTNGENAARIIYDRNGSTQLADIDALMRQNSVIHPLLLPPEVNALEPPAA